MSGADGQHSGCNFEFFILWNRESIVRIGHLRNLCCAEAKVVRVLTRATEGINKEGILDKTTGERTTLLDDTILNFLEDTNEICVGIAARRRINCVRFIQKSFEQRSIFRIVVFENQ